MIKASLSKLGLFHKAMRMILKKCSRKNAQSVLLLERILGSIGSSFAWIIYKADAKASFLQTGNPNWDVYVKPSVESENRSRVPWQLDSAADGMVNANAKRKAQFDHHCWDLGLQQSKHLPQLSLKRRKSNLLIVVVKDVDFLKVIRDRDHPKNFIKDFDKKFKLGTISQGPGDLRLIWDEYSATGWLHSFDQCWW